MKAELDALVAAYGSAAARADVSEREAATLDDLCARQRLQLGRLQTIVDRCIDTLQHHGHTEHAEAIIERLEKIYDE